MNKKQFIYVLLIILLTFLAACSGSNNAEENESNQEKEDSTREFETAKGTVEIPSNPERIVTDYYGGELLSVGANVVGVEPTAFDNPFIADLLKDATDVGYPLNEEKVLELDPDLIVVMYDDNYEALSKIAPTIHIPYGTTSDIEETVNLFGDIVGSPEKAEEFMTEFNQEAEEGRKKLEGIIDSDDTFGIYELTNKGELWTFGENAGRGGQALYNALGLKMPEKNAGGENTKQISLEVLPEYAADYMFLTTYDPENEGTALKDLKDSAVWKNLNANKQDQIFYNDFDTFYRYDPIAVKEQIGLLVDKIIERKEQEE
ncbi:ABC transporter substrate-binding protein [Virgibacillus salexigens]|uniref:ABC transporter substrate-binding protein n=1 Tax=Virgibacillus salexigens TaxID=61016 RepID=UPI0030816D50